VAIRVAAQRLGVRDVDEEGVPERQGGQDRHSAHCLSSLRFEEGRPTSQRSALSTAERPQNAATCNRRGTTSERWYFTVCKIPLSSHASTAIRKADGAARSAAADWVIVAVCAPHQVGGAGGQDLGPASTAGLHPR
jgi:hypothetical protein